MPTTTLNGKLIRTLRTNPNRLKYGLDYLLKASGNPKAHENASRAIGVTTRTLWNYRAIKKVDEKSIPGDKITGLMRHLGLDPFHDRRMFELNL